MNLRVFICFLNLILFIFAQNGLAFEKGWLNKDIDVLDKQKRKTATLRFGSPVIDGSVYGWVQDNDNCIYSKDKLIKYGIILEHSSLLYTGKTFNTMKEIRILAHADKRFISSSFDHSVSRYDEMYYSVCSSCHSAVQHERFSIEQWKGIMSSMKSHAMISDNDAENLFHYIELMLANH